MSAHIVTIDVLSSYGKSQSLIVGDDEIQQAKLDVVENHNTYAKKYNYNYATLKPDNDNFDLQTKIQYIVEWLENDDLKHEDWIIIMNNNYVFGDITLSVSEFLQNMNVDFQKHHIVLTSDIYFENLTVMPKKDVSYDAFFVKRSPLSLDILKKWDKILGSQKEFNTADLLKNIIDNVFILPMRNHKNGFGINTVSQWPIDLTRHSDYNLFRYQPGDFLARSSQTVVHWTTDRETKNYGLFRVTCDLCLTAKVIDLNQSEWISLRNTPFQNFEELLKRKFKFLWEKKVEMRIQKEKEEEMRIQQENEQKLQFKMKLLAAGTASSVMLYFILKNLYVNDVPGRVWRWIRLRREAAKTLPSIFKRMQTIERGLIRGNSSARTKFIQITNQPKSRRK
jgi:hypothetical protein